MNQHTISQEAKIANHRAKLPPAKAIYVGHNERVCINCIWYERYFHQNRGNVHGFVPTDKGHCLWLEQERGPMRQPCKNFETKERPRS